MAPTQAPVKKGSKVAKVVSHKFVIDFTRPESEGIIDGAAFEKFLIESIKIEGKTGQLTDVLSVTSSGAKITVDASVHFSKRALKYLSKKFIKRISMSEYLKVVATAPNTYELKFRKEMEMEQDAE